MGLPVRRSTRISSQATTSYSFLEEKNPDDEKENKDHYTEVPTRLKRARVSNDENAEVSTVARTRNRNEVKSTKKPGDKRKKPAHGISKEEAGEEEEENPQYNNDDGDDSDYKVESDQEVESDDNGESASGSDDDFTIGNGREKKPRNKVPSRKRLRKNTLGESEALTPTSTIERIVPPFKGSLTDLAYLFTDDRAALRRDVTDIRCDASLRHQHRIDYHRPLLLDSQEARDQLLFWFDTVNADRAMPWRKPWIDTSQCPVPLATAPIGDGEAELAATLRRDLEKRAYEVWISEIMLQQTRVATVIEYWNRWMAKWPTLRDLAVASEEEVLFAWKGLGYYSRAKRIHQAAQVIVKDDVSRGLLPDDATRLQSLVPGVGRYTAGAITSIVYGIPEPMVDGNVLRVLSRQMGLYADVKGEKLPNEMLWKAADVLVKKAAGWSLDEATTESKSTSITKPARATTTTGSTVKPKQPARSNIPGRWGQALMELGSTVCKPISPTCAECPIQSTCRAYQEGIHKTVAVGVTKPKEELLDIEDCCGICQVFPDTSEMDDIVGNADEEDKPKKRSAKEKSSSKQPTILQAFSPFWTKATSSGDTTDKSKETTTAVHDEDRMVSPAQHQRAIRHASLFPPKQVKKPLRQEEIVACGVYCMSTQRFLLAKRPSKGLLANMWELPSLKLAESGVDDATKPTQGTDTQGQKQRAQVACQFVDERLLAADGECNADKSKSWHQGEVDSIPWIFSHLKLTMHVQVFVTDGEAFKACLPAKTCAECTWYPREAVDQLSMGTGMRKAWDAVLQYLDTHPIITPT